MPEKVDEFPIRFRGSYWDPFTDGSIWRFNEDELVPTYFQSLKSAEQSARYYRKGRGYGGKVTINKGCLYVQFLAREEAKARPVRGRRPKLAAVQ